MPPNDPHAARLRRLKFRAARRGFLEADLILGRFAATHADNMDARELDTFEALLDEADQDIYGWLVGLTPVPARWDIPLMARLRAFRPDAAAQAS